MNFIKSERHDVLINPVFQALSDEGRALGTFVLPSLNIRRHFLTFDPFITPGLSNAAPVIYFPGALIYSAGFNVNQNFKQN
jgi:hypothetical protein